MAGIVDVIQSRRSVRTFKDQSLTSDDQTYVEHVIQSLETPFGAPVEFRFLDAVAHGLKSPVIIGAHKYDKSGRKLQIREQPVPEPFPGEVRMRAALPRKTASGKRWAACQK